MKFKARSHFHNINVQGEAASPDIEAAASHAEDLAKTVHESGDTTQQIFDVDETVLCWKKMSSRTFTARETSMPGFKASKARLTFLLASGS